VHICIYVLTRYSVAVSIPETNTIRPKASAIHRLRWMKMLFFLSFVLLKYITNISTLKYVSYLSNTYVNTTIERQRHTRDIAHPMYEIIDKASSAGVGYGETINHSV